MKLTILKPFTLSLTLAGLLSFFAFSSLAQTEPAAEKAKLRLILLGTKGGPSFLQTKSLPPSTVLLVGDNAYLIDAGYGASLRLVDAGIALRKLKGIFLTHLHNDHTSDYPGLLINSWSTGLKDPVTVLGPAGTKDMTDHIWQAFKIDIDLRIVDEAKLDPRNLFQVTEYQAGLIFENEDLKVTALAVPHPPFKMGEAFAFKVEAAGQVLVFSGDTNYYEPLAEFAKGADVLVHEATHAEAVQKLAARVMKNNPERQEQFAKAIISHHLSAEEVGKIAQQAQVKKLVLNHKVPADDPTLTDAMWQAEVAKHYTGPIIVGHDSLEIDLKTP